MKETIGEVNSFVEQFTQALTALVEGVAIVARDEVAGLLSQFNDFVPQVNERLQRCSALLAKGLRDEALGYEADEPPLLATVDLLDVSSRPQWSRWLEALRALGFPEPEMPKVEIAAALREAQEQGLALKPLLEDWRRGNLANAPLPSRIAVLRRLRKQDPNNEAWFECLKAHEKQRAMQIEAEVQAAVAEKDEASLSLLSDEFKAAWLDPPPQKIQKTVENALQSIRAARIENDIEQVAGALAAAAESRDVDAGRSLRERWNQLAQEKGAFSADDERFMRAAPVLEWVDRHDRLESLFAEVWQSLDSQPATREAKREWVRSLTRMRDEVEDLAARLRDDVDLEPIERLRARVARVEEDQRRELGGRRRLMYLTVTAVSLLGIGSVATVVSVVRHNDRIRQALAEVDGVLDRVERCELAPDHLPAFAWPEWLKSDPVVSARLGLLQQTVAQEKQRRVHLDQSLATLTEYLDALSKAPGLTALGIWPDPFVPATKLLDEIHGSGWAKTDEDKASLAKAEGMLQNAARRFQRDGDEVLKASIRALADKVARLAKQAGGPQGESVLATLTEIEEEVVSLREAATATAAPGAIGEFAQMTKASKGAMQPLGQHGDIRTSLDRIRNSVNESQRFAESEKGIDGAIEDWPRYAERLAAAATEFREQAIARDYQEAAKDLPLWKALADWNAFAVTCPSLAELSSDEAKALLAQFAKIRESADSIQLVKSFLDRHEKTVRVFAGRDPAAVGKELEDWLASAWLGEIEWVVTTNTDQPTGKRKLFYCLQSPKEGAPRFKYLPAMKDPAGEWPAEKQEPLDEYCSTSRSPQRILADALETNCVATIIDHAKGVALDLVLVDAVERTLAAKNVEPCLRMLTLRRLLLLGSEVSPIFQTPEVRKFLAGLDDGNGGVPDIERADLGAFVAPDRDTNLAYGKVKKFSDRQLSRAVPVAKQLRDNVDALRKSLDQPDAPLLTCVGRLGRDAGGKIALIPLTKTTLTPGDELKVLVPSGALDSIGKCGSDGRASLDGSNLVAGVPVFVSQRRKGK